MINAHIMILELYEYLITENFVQNLLAHKIDLTMLIERYRRKRYCATNVSKWSETEAPDPTTHLLIRMCCQIRVSSCEESEGERTEECEIGEERKEEGEIKYFKAKEG